jgi:hypothetical protein
MFSLSQEEAGKLGSVSVSLGPKLALLAELGARISAT